MSVIAFVAFLTLHAPQEYSPTGPKIEFTMHSGKSFVITTDPKTSPKTAAHIISLVKQKVYDKMKVHRVEHWIVQFGDPSSKTLPMTDKRVGEGSFGKTIDFEISETDFKRGVVGIASEGLQRGGDSHIFILKKDWERLYHSYAVLGKVTKGMEVIDSIQKGDVIRSARVIK